MSLRNIIIKSGQIKTRIGTLPQTITTTGMKTAVYKRSWQGYGKIGNLIDLVVCKIMQKLCKQFL